MAVDLPQDIVADILIRLPVRDLLRYRSVAKPWCSLIDDPRFINNQLGRAAKTASRLGLVTRKSSRDWMWVSLDCLDTVKDLNLSIKVGLATRLVGSCNGLLALIDIMSEVLAIWNPSTGRYRKLPDSEIEFPIEPSCYSRNVFYGFGYDRVGDDYKLLRSTQIPPHLDDGGDRFDSEVVVYSAKTDSWKRMCKKMPYYLLEMECNEFGVLASNALHFVASRDSRSGSVTLIIAFDLEKEDYFEVPMPSFEDQRSLKCLAVLEGSLCAVYRKGLEMNLNRVEVWMMKEYGVKESWTEMFSVEDNTPFSSIRPVTYLRGFGNDRILLKKCSNLVTCDLEGGAIGDLNVKVIFANDSVVCVESMVGLDEREGNGWETGVES